MTCPHLLYKAVLERRKYPQAGSFAFIDELYAAIVQHLSTIN